MLREAAEHVAVLVGSDAFRHFRAWIRRRDEGGHIAVLDAADPNAPPERRVHLFIRLRVGHVNYVIADVHAAWATELFPFRQEFSILIENLDAVVRPKLATRCPEASNF